MNAKLQSQLKQAIFAAFWLVYDATPKDTWNMAVNALKMEQTTDGVVIYIDEAVAPYVVYTNEPWTSPYWKGKKNPNEGWFDKVAQAVADKIAELLGGKKED